MIKTAAGHLLVRWPISRMRMRHPNSKRLEECQTARVHNMAYVVEVFSPPRAISCKKPLKSLSRSKYPDIRYMYIRRSSSRLLMERLRALLTAVRVFGRLCRWHRLGSRQIMLNLRFLASNFRELVRRLTAPLAQVSRNKVNDPLSLPKQASYLFLALPFLLQCISTWDFRLVSVVVD